MCLNAGQLPDDGARNETMKTLLLTLCLPAPALELRVKRALIQQEGEASTATLFGSVAHIVCFPCTQAWR